MIELSKKKLTINNIVINKKNQKALDFWMIWDSIRLLIKVEIEQST